MKKPSVAVEELKKKIVKKVDSMRKEILRMNRYIYDNPELGMEEYKSSKVLISALRNHGFHVESPIGGLKTAFRAKLAKAKSGPTIAFLAEYDALPQIGHGCGHNFIGTAGTFAGIAFEAVGKQIPGQVLVIGTPAEETHGGKIILLEKGIFRDVDAAMMVHPSTETEIRATSLASQVIELEFTGKTAHAAAAPWMGVNALDALIQAYVSINILKKQLRPSARIPGIITYGGERANVVPDRAVGVFSLRADTMEYLKEVVQKVIKCAEAAAIAHGAKLRSRTLDRPYFEMRSNPTLERAFGRNWKDVGGKTFKNPLKCSGSLDIGNISHELPCIHPSIAIAGKKIATHSVKFRDATLTDRAAEQLMRAIKALALTAVDVLADKNVFGEMNKKFQKKEK